ncbi:CoA-binding protein [Halobacillus sp. A1]|uniref:CoA-binding protein n=1 Tax=Halobacillus sp. A1 TaxID=2880262 RepID=UPI0020A6A11A|nr:CoA-binding protein [Halobacillus sp. A1]MCP3030824.1 CoA-binding protein [Halobacillus sp. A1]
MFENPSQEKMRDVLHESKTIAVVGLSDKPHRTSYQVSQAMQQAGYKIIPVNPTIKSSLGEKSYSSLQEIEEPVDIINVFRRSAFLTDIAEEAARINAKAFWAQQGVYHEKVPDILNENGMLVIMNNCIKVAHSILR